jgi:hypothetical protein
VGKIKMEVFNIPSILLSGVMPLQNEIAGITHGQYIKT